MFGINGQPVASAEPDLITKKVSTWYNWPSWQPGLVLFQLQMESLYARHFPNLDY